MQDNDTYAQLRPPSPASDLCSCTGRPVKVMSALGYNPVHCMDCNQQVPPETLDLAPAVVAAIAAWWNVYDAIDRLSLDSGTYEEWACKELSRIASAINRRGRAVQQMVDRVRSCCYWCS